MCFEIFGNVYQYDKWVMGTIMSIWAGMCGGEFILREHLDSVFNPNVQNACPSHALR